MKLIAKKPCSFGGRQFYIGDTIPEELVAQPSVQENFGTISVVADEEIQEGILLEGEGFAGKVIVPVVGKEDGDTAEVMAVPLTEGEVQSVFSIMQMGVQEAEKAISAVSEENILIVLHACDSRSGVKKAAQKRADTLSIPEEETNESVGGNDFTEESADEHNTEK